MKLPEIVAAGIYNSQVSAKNISISKNRKTTMFEIELPVTSGGVSYINNDSMSITPDMIICAKPGNTRHTKFPFECYYVHLILEEGYLFDILSEVPYFFKTDKSELYRSLFTLIIKYYDTLTPKDEIILHSRLLELIYTVSRDAENINKKSEGKRSGAKIIENAVIYIKNNLTEDLSLKSIAKAMSISHIHFHNSFKSSVGKTVHEYVEEQRIKKAIDLLITTDMTLTQIAFECGFSSQSYFSYVFKRKMKKTPREYIKEINEKYEI